MQQRRDQVEAPQADTARLGSVVPAQRAMRYSTRARRWPAEVVRVVAKRKGHTVVLGASLAGLLAARVLADRFDRVTIVERDPLPDGPESRKGVPQGRHAHLLLAAGENVFRSLFPGLIEELIDDGAVRAGMLADGLFWQLDGYRVRHGRDIDMLFASRPFIESRIRRRLIRTEGITIQTGVVRELVAREGRVEGVSVEQGAEVAMIEADLVIDATGRGSQSGKWLEKLGYAAPPTSAVHIDMGYASRFVRRTPGQFPDRRWFLTAATPPAKRFAGALPVEGDRWLVTLAGYHGDHAPTDDSGFLAFAQSLPRPDIAELLQVAAPLTPIVTHKVPSSRWRHFERLRRGPAGFVALGDAICSFNPIYGQGMSSAALQAVALGEVVDDVGATSEDMPRRFYRSAGKIVLIPWQIAVGGDFVFAETTGPKPPMTDMLNRYLKKVVGAAQHDEVVAHAVINVQHLIADPRSLLRPRIMLRSLSASRRRGVISEI